MHTFYFFTGTKKDEYHLDVTASGAGYSIEKVAVDTNLITRGENTIKIIRTARCKNENIHAALKQKFQIFDSVVELCYLEPLSQQTTVSKYSAIAAIGCSLLNLEHPGFPVNFLREENKIPKALQLLANFNTENFLQHISVEHLNWTETTVDDLISQRFPALTPDTFHQIFEVTSSIHALTKGQGCGSNIRKREVSGIPTQNIAEYNELLSLPPQNLRVRTVRLENAPDEYLAKQAEGILPAWPGSGTLFRLQCFPSNRSSIDRRNWKMPTVFILDDSSPNPLNCTYVFKSVGAITCFNCPSVNGSLGGCCHLGWMFMVLSAPFVIQSRNKGVQLVNIKNPQSFLHPDEVMQSTITHVGMPTFNVRQSYDTRENSLLLRASDLLVPISDSSNPQVSRGAHVAQAFQVSQPSQTAQPSQGTLPSQPRPVSQPSPANQEAQPSQDTQPSQPSPANQEAQPSQDAQHSQPHPVSQSSQATQASVSSVQSLYGYSSGTNIEAVIRRAVSRNPSRSIPEPSTHQGNDHFQNCLLPSINNKLTSIFSLFRDIYNLLLL